jgi:threonine synthase
MGERVYLNVPSGNFGNVLGGYYAQKMGLAVEKLVVSSNENDVLTRLINSGEYDIRHSKLIATTSPAMDILISSNVERVIYDICGAERTKELMLQLESQKYYKLSADELKKLQDIFMAGSCSGEEGQAYIKSAFEDGYLMDPHTATCFKTYEECSKTGIKTIAYSTAEWTKFSPTIANALTGERGTADLEALKAISTEADIEIPATINELFSKEIKHPDVIDKEQIESEILSFL